MWIKLEDWWFLLIDARYTFNEKNQKRWLAGKITGWAYSVETLAGDSRKQTQSTYTGLQKSLQQGWAFVQQVTPGICNAIGPV